MQWVVEARAFDNGKIVAKVRQATAEDENGCTETRTCDIWIDLFEDEQEARQFCRSYRNA